MKRKRGSRYSNVPTLDKVPAGSARQMRKVVREMVERSKELNIMDHLVLTYTDPAVTTGTTGTKHINAVALGASPHQRAESICIMKSIRIKLTSVFHFKHELVTDNLYGIQKRILIVIDKQPTSALPNTNLVFTGIATDGTSAGDMWSGVNPNETDRFEVLREIVENPDPSVENTKTSFGGALIVYRYHDIFIPLKGRQLRYNKNNAAGALSNVQEGAIYLITIATRATTEHYSQTYANVRFRWVDA